MNEVEILKLIRNALSNRILNSKHESYYEFITDKRYGEYLPDLVFKYGRRNMATIEIKSPNNLKEAISTFDTNYYFIFKIRYYVYTDGEQFYIFDRFKNPKDYRVIELEKFVIKLTSPISKNTLLVLKNSATDIIYKVINENSEKFPRLRKYIVEMGIDNADELKLNSNYGLYFENGKTDINSFENQFFLHLMDNKVPDSIYRYCSFGRAFQILKDKEIAMLGLLGMNDTTEPNYVDNYLNGRKNEPWEMSETSRKSINNRFIMSCTTLEDDLMQWRLYGDNGKGACVKFQVNERINLNERFYLGRVKYANENGDHPELLLLKRIIDNIRENLFFDVKFILLFAWRHFFKTKDYEYEQEVRLLHIRSSNHIRENDANRREKEWILAEPFSIANPMVKFKLSAYSNEFPLKISEVILGPKCPEKELNSSQLEVLIYENGLHAKIKQSEKNIYR